MSKFKVGDLVVSEAPHEIYSITSKRFGHIYRVMSAFNIPKTSVATSYDIKIRQVDSKGELQPNTYNWDVNSYYFSLYKKKLRTKPLFKTQIYV